MSDSSIPIVDLSPFLCDGNGMESEESEKNKKKAMVSEMISKACREYGFFQIKNHGMASDLMSRALELSNTFFEYPTEEKLKYPLDHAFKKKESLNIYHPSCSNNLYPDNPHGFREVLENVFLELTKICQIPESIIGDCLGLNPKVFRELNKGREGDLMLASYYSAAKEEDDDEDYIGVSEHKDPSFMTLIMQDEVGGLEVLNQKNGEWIQVTPLQDTLVVNIGDILQVLTNKKWKSPKHRVMRKKGRSRKSYVFFYKIEEEKYIEPLPEFTNNIGKEPKYRRFLYKDYIQLRINNTTHPPHDQITIDYYAINNV